MVSLVNATIFRLFLRKDYISFKELLIAAFGFVLVQNLVKECVQDHSPPPRGYHLWCNRLQCSLQLWKWDVSVLLLFQELFLSSGKIPEP